MLGAEGEEILENNFLRDTELEDKNIKEIKEEHEFDKTKDAFDDGAVLPLLDFFYDGEHLSEYFRLLISCHLMAKTLDLLIFFAVTDVKILWQIAVYQYMLNLEIFFTRIQYK